MCDIFKHLGISCQLPPVLKCHLQGLLPDYSRGSWGLGGILILFSLTSVAVKIKKPIKTKFRMPVFNWVALKPNQINGTVFNEIDDERILEVSFHWLEMGPSLCSKGRVGALLTWKFQR